MSAQRLIDWFAGLNNVAIAFSGGVDSTFLLACAREALGEKVVAFTIRTSFFPDWEYEDADSFAKELGVRHITLDVDMMQHEDVIRNDDRRCYHCKHMVFGYIKLEAAKIGIDTICDGSNLDDAGDFRPGEEAAKELGVKSPLRELGYTKQEIRECSAAMALKSAGKPAYACLATRIPTGERITEERLRRVEKAEDYLHHLDFWDIRVRDHGDLARIEVSQKDMKDFVKLDFDRISKEFRELGYTYTTLELSGYTMGSMNAREDK